VAVGGERPHAEGASLDDVAVEAPLELRFAGTAATVLLRTPGDDDDLVLGFLHGEGIVRSASDLVMVTRPTGLPPAEVGNVVDVTLVPALADATLDRGLYSSSSCGACGKRSVASLEVHAAPLAPGPRVPRAVLASLPERLRAAQPVFARTGGLHACGLFTADGTLVALREDVGRHNALDKVVGWSLREGRVPLSGLVLVVSGRVSYELAQKAVVAGAPVLVAVGAPSSLAIEVARAHGLTLVGFTRPASFNVYTGAERVGD
jgi:FdhD protein